MTFRARLLLGFGAVVLVPLTVFGLRVRVVMTNRLTTEYQQRVAALASVIRVDLDQRSEEIARRLAALREAIALDNKFRSAVVQQGSERSYLLDYAADATRLAGLSLLQIQDETGRIVSSGHFRNEYDRSDPALPASWRRRRRVPRSWRRAPRKRRFSRWRGSIPSGSPAACSPSSVARR